MKKDVTIYYALAFYLIGSRDAFERMTLRPFSLKSREVLLKSGTDLERIETNQIKLKTEETGFLAYFPE